MPSLLSIFCTNLRCSARFQEDKVDRNVLTGFLLTSASFCSPESVPKNVRQKVYPKRVPKSVPKKLSVIVLDQMEDEMTTPPSIVSANTWNEESGEKKNNGD